MTDHLRPEWVTATNYPDGYQPGDTVPTDAVDAPPPFQPGDRATLHTTDLGTLHGTIREVWATPRSRLDQHRRIIRTHAITWGIRWQPDDNRLLTISTTADRLTAATMQPALF